MPLVAKCCFCCSLKYGYYTYGIVCLALRMCAISTLYFLIPSAAIASFRKDYHDSTQALMAMMGWLIGWFMACSVGLFIALKGMAQKGSILIYPYIVILMYLCINCFYFDATTYGSVPVSSSTMGVLIGWLVASSVALFIALKGIAQERSILIFPHIVLLIVDLIAGFIGTIIIAAIATIPAGIVAGLIISGGINIYAAICLISLYEQIKEDENRRLKMIENIALEQISTELPN